MKVRITKIIAPAVFSASLLAGSALPAEAATLSAGPPEPVERSEVILDGGRRCPPGHCGPPHRTGQ